MRITYNHEYTRRLRIAAIGCGGHAIRNIFPTFQYAPVDFVAACDLNLERAENACRVFGGREAYTDHRAMLDRVRPDAVFIVTNYDEFAHPRYPSLAADAMRAGAHAWIEKPPAASSAEIRALIDISAQTDRLVGVGLKKMFTPAMSKAREIIARPEFGGVASVTARYPQNLPPYDDRADDRKMVGFLDHVCHPYSVLLALAGPVSSIYVERASSGASVTAIRFRNGAVGSLHLSAGQSGMAPLEQTEIVGNRANIVIENNVRVTYYRPGEPASGYGREGTMFGPDESAPLHWEPEFSLGQLYNKGIFLLGYAPEIIDFCDCVLTARKPERGSLGDALEIMKVYEAYRERDGQVIHIAE